MANGWGGRRAGAGRPKGAKNRGTPCPRDYPDATTPLAFLLCVMNDPRVAERRRLAAAITAAPYVHPRIGGRRRTRRPLAWADITKT